jgi:hypothetical protein
LCGVCVCGVVCVCVCVVCVCLCGVCVCVCVFVDKIQIFLNVKPGLVFTNHRACKAELLIIRFSPFFWAVHAF